MSLRPCAGREQLSGIVRPHPVHQDLGQPLACAIGRRFNKAFEELDLARAVDRVATISSERGRAVKLSFDEGKLRLSVTNPDAGSAEEEIEAEYDEAAIDIGFNSRYLADILAALEGDTVLVKLGDPGSPTLFQKSEADNLLIVLMPMRA